MDNEPNFVEEEYENQLFGFTFNQLLEGFYNLADSKIASSVENLVSTLRQNCNDASNYSLKEIENNLIRSYKEASKPSLQKLKEKIQDFFQIPLNILLPEDLCQQNQYTDEAVGKVDAEIDDLSNRAKAGIFMENALLKEIVEMKSKIDNMELKILELENVLLRLKESTEKYREVFNLLVND